MLQGKQGMKVRGGDERHGQGFTRQVLGRDDAAAIAHHQRLSVIDVVENPEQLRVYTTAHGSGNRAAARHADLHVAGRHRQHHIAATVEVAPLDIPASGLLELLFGDGVLPRREHALHADGHCLRLGRGGKAQGQRGGG
ncbi:hypothetical protein D3C80_1579630 [compost metagenome]